MFFIKMFLLRIKKVDLLKSAHGTTWGAMAMAMAMVMVMAMGGVHFGLIVLRHTASLFCHH